MTNPLIAARDAFAAKMPETRTHLNGREWGVIDAGDTEGPALLVMPGTLGRGDIFWQQIAALQDLRILAVSYPETGGISDWIVDLCLLLDQRGLAQTAVLGSSLGGYVAQAFAASFPDRVSHLFAANTLASVAGISQNPPYSLDLWNAPIDLVRGGFATAMQAWGQAHPDQADLVGFLLAESAGRIPDGEMRARLAALKDAPDLPADTRPAAQTTIIETDDDPLIAPPWRALVQARYRMPRCFVSHGVGIFPISCAPNFTPD